MEGPAIVLVSEKRLCLLSQQSLTENLGAATNGFVMGWIWLISSCRWLSHLNFNQKLVPCISQQSHIVTNDQPILLLSDTACRSSGICPRTRSSDLNIALRTNWMLEQFHVHLSSQIFQKEVVHTFPWTSSQKKGLDAGLAFKIGNLVARNFLLQKSAPAWRLYQIHSPDSCDAVRRGPFSKRHTKKIQVGFPWD